MKVIIVGLFVVIVVAILYGLMFRKRNLASVNNIISATLEEKLSILAQCGIQLADPFTKEELLKSWDRKEFETDDFDLVLTGLGMTEEQEPWRNRSINLWYFDTEAIEDHGDYKRIAERLIEMSQGSLKLEEIRDYVDIDNREAWLSFSFRGHIVKISLKVEDDFVDPLIFGKFVDLLEQSDQSKIYIYYDLGGQDCIIGCVTHKDFECLKNHKINFVPLT